MDPVTTAAVINASVQIMESATRAIAAANAGDVEQARAHLRAARQHFDAASAKWDAAGAAATPGGVQSHDAETVKREI